MKTSNKILLTGSIVIMAGMFAILLPNGRMVREMQQKAQLFAEQLDKTEIKVVVFTQQAMVSFNTNPGHKQEISISSAPSTEDFEIKGDTLVVKTDNFVKLKLPYLQTVIYADGTTDHIGTQEAK